MSRAIADILPPATTDDDDATSLSVRRNDDPAHGCCSAASDDMACTRRPGNTAAVAASKTVADRRRCRRDESHPGPTHGVAGPCRRWNGIFVENGDRDRDVSGWMTAAFASERRTSQPGLDDRRSRRMPAGLGGRLSDNKLSDLQDVSLINDSQP